MNNFAMFWLAIAVIFGVIEATTSTLTTIWMAIAAAFTAIIAAFGVPVAPQFLVFAIVSAVLVILTRPLARRVLSKNTVPTNADRIISAKGVVIERISSLNESGQIKVMGQIWSAKSETDDDIPEGTVVVVTGLEGVRAVVEKAEELQTA